MPEKHRIFTVSVAKVYPYYVDKAEKKGRTKSEVDSIICWLTGYSQPQLERALKQQTDFETFLKEAPKPNPLRSSIKGVICGPFYRKLLPLLGFTTRVDVPGWLQFEAPGDEATEFFGVTEDPAHVANRTRIAFWAASKDRVNELAGRLSALGAQKIEGPCLEGPVHYAVFFEDPSGNALEICYRPQSFHSSDKPA